MRHRLRGPLSCSKSAQSQFAPFPASSLANSPGCARRVCSLVSRFLGSSISSAWQHRSTASISYRAKRKSLVTRRLCDRRQHPRRLYHLEDGSKRRRSCPSQTSIQTPTGPDQPVGREPLESFSLSARDFASTRSVDAAAAGCRRIGSFAQAVSPRLQRRTNASICISRVAWGYLWPICSAAMDPLSQQVVDPDYVGNPRPHHRWACLRNLEVAASG